MPPTIHEVAEQLASALESADEELLGPLLDPGVRWGGEEETEQTCHSRGEVVAWYRQLRDAGARAQVTETVVRERAVVLTLVLTGREGGPDAARLDVVHQVFHLEEGLVIDIRGYPQRGLALAWADVPVARS
jgi:hypothetical protein